MLSGCSTRDLSAMLPREKQERNYIGRGSSGGTTGERGQIKVEARMRVREASRIIVRPVPVPLVIVVRGKSSGTNFVPCFFFFFLLFSSGRGGWRLLLLALRRGVFWDLCSFVKSERRHVSSCGRAHFCILWWIGGAGYRLFLYVLLQQEAVTMGYNEVVSEPFACLHWLSRRLRPCNRPDCFCSL